MPFDTQMAIVSHYLHNQGLRFEATYNLKLADSSRVLKCKALDNNKLANACVCQKIHLS